MSSRSETADLFDYQNSRRFRDLADEARIKAGAETDIDLQASYFELAQDYEMLAQTLERIERKTSAILTSLMNSDQMGDSEGGAKERENKRRWEREGHDYGSSHLGGCVRARTGPDDG